MHIGLCGEYNPDDLMEAIAENQNINYLSVDDNNGEVCLRN